MVSGWIQACNLLTTKGLKGTIINSNKTVKKSSVLGVDLTYFQYFMPSGLAGRSRRAACSWFLSLLVMPFVVDLNRPPVFQTLPSGVWSKKGTSNIMSASGA
jgi:hypothetical protein